MRKWMVVVVGLALSLATIGAALAAPSAGPRLDGKFKMTATILRTTTSASRPAR